MGDHSFNLGSVGSETSIQSASDQEDMEAVGAYEGGSGMTFRAHNIGWPNVGDGDAFREREETYRESPKPEFWESPVCGGHRDEKGPAKEAEEGQPGMGDRDRAW